MILMEEKKYLACESRWTFWGLILAAGMFGAYTYNLRGGVFCNAQTANFVLFAMELGRGKWIDAAYYIIPISAYLLGAIFSEILAVHVKKFHLLRWDTILIGFEAIIVFIIGCLPPEVPDQVAQVALNFICSMQFNTFRQFEGTPMATTFCTNHLRQLGSFIVKYSRHKDKDSLSRIKKHGSMVGMFVIGATVCTMLCVKVGLKAIWIASVVLLLLFIYLSYEDLTVEKGLLHRVPKGH